MQVNTFEIYKYINNHKANSHRYRLTKKYCDPYESTKERIKNVPPIRISETVWKEFILSVRFLSFNLALS